MASVVTRDVSEHGVRVDCLSGTPIPLYRLVYFQIDREAAGRSYRPRCGQVHVLSAIFRVVRCSEATGAPSDYALRLLVEPEQGRDAVREHLAGSGPLASAVPAR